MEDFLEHGAALAREGVSLAKQLSDSPPPSANESSTLAMLQRRLGHIPPGTWRATDVSWIGLSMRGLIAIAGSQLAGIADVLATSPLLLHPLMTLVRGVAEASGRIYWLAEPFLDTPDAPLSSELSLSHQEQLVAWDRRASKMLARSQCSYLRGLAERRNRRKKSHGTQSQEVIEAESAIRAYKADLAARHYAGDLILTGGKAIWSVRGEAYPESSTLVTAVTERAYGEDYVGRGANPYPLYSGYAHASLELMFAGGALNASPISNLLAAEASDYRRLIGLALRTFAVGYEIAAHVLDHDLDTLHAWDEDVDKLVVEP